MLIIKPSLVATDGNRKFFSDDVDLPTRFFGAFMDLLGSESTCAVRVLFLDNDVSRVSGFDMNLAFFDTRYGNSFVKTLQKQNPWTVTFENPILSPNGVTMALRGADSTHVREDSIHFFVER